MSWLLRLDLLAVAERIRHSQGLWPCEDYVFIHLWSRGLRSIGWNLFVAEDDATSWLYRGEILESTRLPEIPIDEVNECSQ